MAILDVIKSFLNPSKYRSGNPLPKTNYGGAETLYNFFGSNGDGAFFSYGNYDDALKAFKECAPLQTIVTRQSEASVNGIVSFRDENKNLKETKETKLFLSKLKNPNIHETYETLIQQIVIHVKLYEFCVIYPSTTTGFNDNKIENVVDWIVIPREFIHIDENVTFDSASNIDNARIYINGIPFMFTELIIITSNSLRTQGKLIPESTIKCIQTNINNIIGAFKSEGTIIYNRGTSGIITPVKTNESPLAIPLTKDDKDVIHKSHKRNYGLLGDQFHIAITDEAVNYIKTGLNIKEMMLHESVKENTKVLCDKFNYPCPLIGILDSKYDNMKQAQIALYQDSINPLVNSIIRQLSSYYIQGLHPYVCFDHLQIFQTSELDKHNSKMVLDERFKLLYDAGVITYDYWCEQSQLPLKTDGTGNKYSYELNNIYNEKNTGTPKKK